MNAMNQDPQRILNELCHQELGYMIDGNGIDAKPFSPGCFSISNPLAYESPSASTKEAVSKNWGRIFFTSKGAHSNFIRPCRASFVR